ncbi:MAG: carboxypeptidase-like regulatory domain-containing protein, partial [Muribaculaceae bacterium]
YWANGTIFNRVPLLKYLKLREAFSFRGLYGKLGNDNNPLHNPDVLLFPELNNCSPMTKTPYMEVGVGIDNILTCLRLDYVWRLTYLDRRGIDRRGLRIQLHFTF